MLSHYLGFDASRSGPDHVGKLGGAGRLHSLVGMRCQQLALGFCVRGEARLKSLLEDGRLQAAQVFHLLCSRRRLALSHCVGKPALVVGEPMLQLWHSAEQNVPGEMQ